MHMNILQKIENMNCMNGMGSMGILNIVLSYSINFIVFYKYMYKPIDQNTVCYQYKIQKAFSLINKWDIAIDVGICKTKVCFCYNLMKRQHPTKMYLIQDVVKKVECNFKRAIKDLQMKYKKREGNLPIELWVMH